MSTSSRYTVGVTGGDVARGAVVGLVGGLCAAGMMSVSHRMLKHLSSESQTPAPQSSDPTVTVATETASVVGYRLNKSQKAKGGTLVHYAFGGLMGALYGGVAEILPGTTAAFGAIFGVAVWLGAHVVAVPALGLAGPPVRQPLGKEAEEFGLHLAYGWTTELVRRALRE